MAAEAAIQDGKEASKMRVLQAMKSNLQKLLAGEGGQDLVEYGLLVSLIALVVIGSMKTVATALLTAFANISTTVSQWAK